MVINGFSKRNVQLLATSIGLVTILFYTLIHTGSLLSRFIEPHFVGYITAFGIELTIVALSIRIGDLKRSRKTPWLFYTVLSTVLIVSTVANISEGFQTRWGVSLSNVGWVDIFVGLSATLLFPITVFALSEIIGGDVDRVVKEQKKSVRSPVIHDRFPLPIEQLQEARHDKQQDRRDKIIVHLSDNPKPNMTDLSSQLGISRSTLYGDLDSLSDKGLISKNGEGWVVNRS